MLLCDSIENIKNIGDKRLKLFNKLNIFTVQDLIEYYPRDYEDRSNIKKTDDLIIGEYNTFIGVIENVAENLKINNYNITKLKISDLSGELEIIWFNKPYLKNYFIKKKEYIFYGKVVDKFGRIQMENPEYECIGSKEILNVGRIVPIYKTTFGLSQKIIRSIIKNTLENLTNQYTDFLPDYILKKYFLCDKLFAVKNIHFPISDEAFFISRKRLVFEELFLMQSSLIKLKGYIKNRLEGIKFKKVDEIDNLLPYKLTNAQKKVLNDIKEDFFSGFSMNRLVQGDVGSGKTAVALLSSYIAIRNGYQVCLMAPTEVLASQHFLYFKNFFDRLDIATVLLTGSQKKKEKNIYLEQIENNEAKMIIGTHAVIQSGVKFDNLGFVITDEQHRFGVNQRKNLAEKGFNPHVLVMTATPIPRTLALILYGDLDISIIDELPPGRQYIDTFFVTTAYLKRIYEFIKKEVSKGHQCYIICSAIEESENQQLKAVISYTENLKEELNGISVDFLHGKMKQEEKNEIMKNFSENKISVLVSTTVIEVGINVTNATLMIILNAERFGLSQLHQLRGRVGRGNDKSYCILISDTKNKYSKKRLEAMLKTNDGFYISELDLKLRGPGDFFGTRQHGLAEFKIANLYKDLDILKEVQEAVLNIDYDCMRNSEINLLENEINKYLNYDDKSIFL